jgi:hypothetical protein
MESIDPNEGATFNEQINSLIAQGIQQNSPFFPEGTPTGMLQSNEFTTSPLYSDTLPMGEYRVADAYLLANGEAADSSDIDEDDEEDIDIIDNNADVSPNEFVVSSTAMLLGNVLGGVIAYQTTANSKHRVWWTIAGVIIGGVATSLAYGIGENSRK